jgi:hypothetical protein
MLRSAAAPRPERNPLNATRNNRRKYPGRSRRALRAAPAEPLAEAAKRQTTYTYLRTSRAPIEAGSHTFREQDSLSVEHELFSQT